MRGIAEISGKQAGDPVRAAEAMIALTERPEAPRHLVLGAIGYEGVTARLRARLAEIEAQREISLGADYPQA